VLLTQGEISLKIAIQQLNNVVAAYNLEMHPEKT
jgi:flagellar hook-basal body complex protein FliE